MPKVAIKTCVILLFVLVMGGFALNKWAFTGVNIEKEPIVIPSTPLLEDITSFHFTVHSRSGQKGAVSSISKGAYEQWYYQPKQCEEALWFKMQRWTPNLKRKLCSWLQNGHGNYYYHSGKKTIYRTNYRLWRGSFGVKRLPTDSAEFTAALDEIEGKESKVEYLRHPETGLLVWAIDHRFVKEARNFKTLYDYNSIGVEDMADYWPQDTPVVDQRDEIHKRGWTYIDIAGEIAGLKVTGVGRMPFITETFESHFPWLRLNVGGEYVLLDGPEGAFVCDSQGSVICAYRSGIFFKGLARPWSGLHCLDVVRRDALHSGKAFATFPSKDRKHAQVVLRETGVISGHRVVYDLDMEKDMIDRLAFVIRDSDGVSDNGYLDFSYPVELSEADSEWCDISNKISRGGQSLEVIGVEWLFSLAAGDLGVFNYGKL